jgi:hypothetical protein
VPGYPKAAWRFDDKTERWHPAAFERGYLAE